MARYIKDFQINVDPQKVHATINNYLQKEGYEYIHYDGENVFKKGKGFMSNPTFFKFSYSGNMVRMETWMKYAFFPGVYLGELGVDGFVGCAVKGSWKNRIKNIENILADLACRLHIIHLHPHRMQFPINKYIRRQMFIISHKKQLFHLVEII